MRRRFAVLGTLALLTVTLQARAVSVNLTVQEALYGGGSTGIARTDEPVTVGIPLPDDESTGVTGVSSLGLTGATVGQFRVLGTWPTSGRAKWVLVDTLLSSLSAGASSSALTLTSAGSGNVGGSDLATDNGTTITVATGAMTVTIKKAHFNGFDTVVVGSTTVVSSGASTGLVVMGPAFNATTCGTCTTVYSSANDASSTASIEENGPVRTVIKATGAYTDGSGNVYLRFTVRLHFWKGLTRVKAQTTLRNADLGASASFASAYKGMAANEWRLTANISGTRTYDIGKDGTVENGTLSGSDDVYLYQGYSLLMEDTGIWPTVVPQYTTDSGWVLKKNGSSLDTGTSAVAEAPAGWADIRDSGGVGVSIGVYQMSAYWPKSLEFKSGGSDVRIGIWPSENSRSYHQAWPQWSTHDLYFNFHDSALASPGNDFLRFQHPLIARAPYTHYNTAAVFPWPLVDPTVEQAFYQSIGQAGVPTIASGSIWPYLDHSVTNGTLFIERAKNWQQGGGENQAELRWSYLMNWLTRGMTGRYLQAQHFYRFQTDDVFPHSDGFAWRDQTAAIDVGHGRPTATSTNSAEAFRNWIDQEHGHWYGMIDDYYMTGDELLKDAILDGPLDWLTTPDTYGTNLALLTITRSVGVRLSGDARMYKFLLEQGDTSNAATVIGYGTTIYNEQAKAPDLCAVSDQVALGCTTPDYPWGPDGTWDGISPLRGIHWAGGGYTSWCGHTGTGPLAAYRGSIGILQHGILIASILEFRAAKGATWDDYFPSLDLAYGMARAVLGESYYEDGSGRWDQEGPYAGMLVDQASTCTPPDVEDDHLVEARNGGWPVFSALWLTEGSLASYEDELDIILQRIMADTSGNWGEFGSYIANHLAYARTTTIPVLQTVTITSVVDNGKGSYTVHWTVPAGAQTYRIKWSPKVIVDWLNFDALATYTFGIDPTVYRPWFSATNVTTPPVPATVGSDQSTTILTGTTGLSSTNFSVKAYVDTTAPTIFYRFRRP